MSIAFEGYTFILVLFVAQIFGYLQEFFLMHDRF